MKFWHNHKSDFSSGTKICDLLMQFPSFYCKFINFCLLVRQFYTHEAQD